jgi:hypothetical protein
MSKEDKLGMDPQLLRLVTRGVVKEGSVKGYVGKCKAAGVGWLRDISLIKMK